MLEDDMVRDSMKMFANSLKQKKENISPCKYSSKSNDILNDEDEEIRVEMLIKEFHKKNPLVNLNFFKEKAKIPYSFTFTQRGNGKQRTTIATLYVGSEICIYTYLHLVGIGEDRNIKIAKYKAAEEGVKNIKSKYGENILKTKEERKCKSTYEIKEELSSVDYEGDHSFLENLFEKCNSMLNGFDNKFELFLSKYERSIIPINDINFIQSFIAKIVYFNKTISIHFNNPILVGSFVNNCSNSKHKIIDILFTHKLQNDEMIPSINNLIKNFKNALKDLYLIFNSEVIVNPINKYDDKNLDLIVIFKGRDYSFNIMIRSSDNAVFYNYLPTHNEIINSKFLNNCKNFDNFNILKRIIRSWRRKFNLLFINPEFLDWVCFVYNKNSINEDFSKILNKFEKDFKNIFNSKLQDIPEIIKKEIISVTYQNLSILQQKASDSLKLIAEEKFSDLFL